MVWELQQDICGIQNMHMPLNHFLNKFYKFELISVYENYVDCGKK